MVDLRIHGDNIVECERTLDLVARALGITEAARLAPINSPVAPSVMVEVPTSGTRVKVTLLPGYSRWNRDILEMIALRGPSGRKPGMAAQRQGVVVRAGSCAVHIRRGTRRA